MDRWTPPHSPQTARATHWQSRAEILKKHLATLSPEELRQVRPDYYWLRFGHDAWKREQARKANFNPDQPRVPAGNPDGGQWTSDGGGRSDPRVISDATPDNNWKPGAQYAAGPRGPRDGRPPLPLHIPAGDGSSIYRPGQVAIVNNAQTGVSTIDETTEKLRTILERVVNSRPEGFGPAYGREIHTDFANAVKSANLKGVRVEQTNNVFDPDVRYGSRESIRTDIIVRNEAGEVLVIYDVKTGNAYLEAGRVQELRAKTGATARVPIIEMHTRRGLSLKALMLRPRYYWVITLRLWNPWTRAIGDLRAT